MQTFPAEVDSQIQGGENAVALGALQTFPTKVGLAPPYRPIVAVTGFGIESKSSMTPTSGVVNSTAEYVLELKNFGDASSLLDISITPDIQGGVLGSSSLTYVGSK